MKFPQQRMSNAGRRRTEAVIRRHVQDMFYQLPTLTGFCLGPDFEVLALAEFSWPGLAVGRPLYEAIMDSLVELAESCPDAVQLIRGRTFARTVH